MKIDNLSRHTDSFETIYKFDVIIILGLDI